MNINYIFSGVIYRNIIYCTLANIQCSDDMLLIYDQMYCVTDPVLGKISLAVTYDCGVSSLACLGRVLVDNNITWKIRGPPVTLGGVCDSVSR